MSLISAFMSYGDNVVVGLITCKLLGDAEKQEFRVGLSRDWRRELSIRHLGGLTHVIVLLH